MGRELAVIRWMKRKNAAGLHRILLQRLVLISIVPIIIIAAVLYEKSGNIIRENTATYTIQMLSKTNQTIDLNLQQYSDNPTIILHDDVQRYLRQAVIEPLDYIITKRLTTIINSSMSEIVGMNSMAIHTLDGQVVARNEYPGPTIIETSLIADIIERNGRVFWRRSPEKIRGNVSLQGIRMIKNMQGPTIEPIGLLTFTITSKSVMKMIEDLRFGDNGNVIVFDSTGQVIAIQNEQTIGAVDMDEVWAQLQGTEGAVPVSTKDRDWFIAYNQSSQTGFYIAGIIPQQEMTPGLSELWKSGMLWAAILLGIVLLLAYHLTHVIVSPIRKLVRAMQQVELRNNQVIAEESNPQEIIFLTNSFNKMTSRLEKSLEEERKARLEALEAQINPHFLYNTLDTIYWMLYLQGEEKIGGMVVSTANILRYSITNNEQTVCMKDEIANIRDYLHIQQVRLGEQLTYEIIVDPLTNHIPVVKLMLQPLVENAVKHGFASTGHIQVMVKKVDHDVHIYVCDNGKGIPEEMIGQLLKQQHKGVGVRNVHERIRRTFGEQYGLQFETGRSSGTMIIIKLPYVTTKERQ